jgi:hypothetical protein
MGYYTSFSGEISIEPPLTWAEIRNSEWLPDIAINKNHSVKLRIEETTVETDEGTMTRRSALAVVPLSDSQYKGYNVIEDVQALIAKHSGHQFSGRFDCEGEDAGDLWRLVVRDNRVTKVEPQIVWPDDKS